MLIYRTLFLLLIFAGDSANFIGGSTGAYISSALDSFTSHPHIHIEVPFPTRTCTTLLNRKDGSLTELIEPSAPVTPADVAQLSQRVHELLARGSLKGLAICGTSPPGVPAAFLCDVVARAPAHIAILLDGYAGVYDLLGTGRVDILKINATELALLAPSPFSTMEARAASCLRIYRLRMVAVTDGPHKALLLWRSLPKVEGHDLGGDGAPADLVDYSVHTIEIPELEVVNSIGAGDCVAAGLLLSMLCDGEWGGKLAPPEAFRLGLAAASASCRSVVYRP